jgi:hypothetical protein
MISERDLDLILASWLADGSDRAPEQAIEAALERIRATQQRRAGGRVRLAWAAAALLLFAGMIAAGIGAGIIKVPSPTPPIEPLRSVSLEDWPVTMSIPAGWTEVEAPCCELRRYKGMSPEGSLSYSHDSPFRATICAPDCHLVELPVSIPYSATAQMQALLDGVGALAGSAAWTTVLPGTVDGLDVGARRLEVSTDGSTTIYVVGVRKRNVVAITWSQPAIAYDATLFDRVLAGTAILDGPGYASGDLIRTTSGVRDYTALVPDLWVADDPPLLDGRPAAGVESRADGQMIVSIGDPDGTIRLCDPRCREVSGVATLDDLQRAVLGPVQPTSNEPRRIGGEAGRSLLLDGTGADGLAVRRQVLIAIHDQRPVVLAFGLRDGLPAHVIEDMIEGFQFTAPPRSSSQVITSPDGRVAIALPHGWERVNRPDGLFLLAHGRQRMTVRVGDENNRLVTCDEPSGPWEECLVIEATTLEDLAAATKPEPVNDGGVGGVPIITQTADTLDGEPAVIWRLHGYEYPARGSEWLTYVVAIIDERPVLIRIWTPDESGIRDLDEVIEGFRLVD